MSTILLTKAPEEGTYIITAVLTDSDDSAVVPNTLFYTLSDAIGGIVDELQDIVITPASTVNIVLTCSNLEVGDQGLERKLLIYGTYDSTYGTDLCLKEEATFTIDDFVNVT